MRRNTFISLNNSSDTALELPADVRWLNLSARVLFSLALLMGAAMLVLWLLRLPAFQLRGIRVDGDVARNNVATIRANALPQIMGNYFTIDLARAKRAFESVPWVRQAVVSRIWPNRLAVRLEEHQAAALWSGDESGDDQLVNTFGEVFQANVGDVEDDALPTLSGPEGSAPQVLATYRLLAPMFERMQLQLTQLSLTGQGSWHAEFDSGAEIELGRGSREELQARVQRFIDTVPQVMARYQRPLVFADLRHQEGYALRLKGITTTLSAADSAARN